MADDDTATGLTRLPGIVYEDSASEMLPSLPSLTGGDTNGLSEVGQMIGDGKSLNILAVATGDLKLSLFVLGMLNIGQVDMNASQLAFGQRSVDAATIKMEFSRSLNVITVVCKLDDGAVACQSFFLPVLDGHLTEVHVVSLQCTFISVLIKYVCDRLHLISFAWIAVALDAHYAVDLQGCLIQSCSSL